jgi:hypothetical protein
MSHDVLPVFERMPTNAPPATSEPVVVPPPYAIVLMGFTCGVLVTEPLSIKLMMAFWALSAALGCVSAEMDPMCVCRLDPIYERGLVEATHVPRAVRECRHRPPVGVAPSLLRDMRRAVISARTTHASA